MKLNLIKETTGTIDAWKMNYIEIYLYVEIYSI